MVSYGEILPVFQLDWLDGFKAEFSNSVIDILEEFVSLPIIESKKNFQYVIADCILQYDRLNDKAIDLKYSILYKDGKKGLAKRVYDSYVKEYENVLGEKYPIPFDQIISRIR